MTSSGIPLDVDSVAEAVTKVGKLTSRACVMKFNSQLSAVVLDEKLTPQDSALPCGTKDPGPKSLWKILTFPDDDVRYYMCQFLQVSKTAGDELAQFVPVLLSWAPDTGKVKPKMLASSTKAAVKKTIEEKFIKNIAVVNLSDKGDLNSMYVLDQAKKASAEKDKIVLFEGEKVGH